MTTVSQTHHLIRRNGVYSYRRRVPTPLVKTLGKKIIQHSLDTTSLKEAVKLRALEDLKWSAQFEAAEKGTGSTSATKVPSETTAVGPPLSEREVTRLVVQYVEREAERSHKSMSADPPENEQQKKEIKTEIEIAIGMLRNRDDSCGDEWVDRVSDKILKAAGAKVDSPPLYAVVAEEVRAALLEVYRHKHAQISDLPRSGFYDHRFDPHRPPDVTFAAITKQFIQLKEEDAAINRTSRKWLDKQQSQADLLLGILGASTPVRRVSWDECMRVRSVLAQMPSNRTKIYGDLPTDVVVARAKAENRPLLSPSSQETILATLREILDLGVKKLLIAVNPAEGIKPIKRDTVAASDKRPPFTLDQIKTFFEYNPFYRECSQHSPPYSFDKSAWRFWLPLICLFMGMRPNEVCQMHVGDVNRTPEGTWYVDIVASTDEDDVTSSSQHKTLKNRSSRRQIPIHPELVAIGFLSFVAAKGKNTSSNPRLFPELKPDKYGNLATYALKRFRDSFLPQVIDLLAGQSFYSFRHSFRDALRRFDAPPDALQALGGWSQGKLTSDDYGSKSNPDYQIKFMKQVSFPGLDLSFLHVKN